MRFTDSKEIEFDSEGYAFRTSFLQFSSFELVFWL